MAIYEKLKGAADIQNANYAFDSAAISLGLSISHYDQFAPLTPEMAVVVLCIVIEARPDLYQRFFGPLLMWLSLYGKYLDVEAMTDYKNDAIKSGLKTTLLSIVGYFASNVGLTKFSVLISEPDRKTYLYPKLADVVESSIDDRGLEAWLPADSNFRLPKNGVRLREMDLELPATIVAKVNQGNAS